ncbi:Hypothetical predicted protein [Olea europaea subsp. europaea]|uniref:Uncharacterized protein n=1 Tax=Olea europaea subsp. europaea TaxID=158383 RepID=A0A8S0T8S0_OLEEU|nr:Hypothetical predicted protein [Olea europaea subsp. europaea]
MTIDVSIRWTGGVGFGTGSRLRKVPMVKQKAQDQYHHIQKDFLMIRNLKEKV